MSRNTSPSTHGADGSGRTASGTFAKGNKLGRGNPLAGRAAKLRARLLRKVTAEDFDAIADKLIAMGKGGDLAAIKELFDRLMGRPVPFEVLETIAELRQRQDELEYQRRNNGHNGRN
jgi:hypothetical protein